MTVSLQPSAPPSDETTTSEVLDYLALVEDYRVGLVDRLRGFGPAADELALWVPDDDLVTSLRNLWDAAACAGRERLAIHLDDATLRGIDRGAVLDMAARFGAASLVEDDRGCTVLVRSMHAAALAETGGARSLASSRGPRGGTGDAHGRASVAPPPSTGSPYADALAAAAADPSHARQLAARSGRRLVAAADDAMMLTLAVDPDSHVVDEAGFFGASGPEDIGMMESLCRIIEGLPLLEAADHGAIRLEHQLRARDSAPPVPGIVTPRAASAAFVRPTKLVRACLSRYRELTDYRDRTNEFDEGPRETWTAMNAAARRQAVDEVLEDFALAHGGEPGDASLVSIEFDVRLVLRLGGELDGPDKPALCMVLERTLHERIDPRLEIYLEEVRDRNKLRRLAVVAPNP